MDTARTVKVILRPPSISFWLAYFFWGDFCSGWLPWGFRLGFLELQMFIGIKEGLIVSYNCQIGSVPGTDLTVLEEAGIGCGTWRGREGRARGGQVTWVILCPEGKSLEFGYFLWDDFPYLLLVMIWFIIEYPVDLILGKHPRVFPRTPILFEENNGIRSISRQKWV